MSRAAGRQHLVAGLDLCAPITALLLSPISLKYLKMQNSFNNDPNHYDDDENTFYIFCFALGLGVGPK